MTVAQTLGVVHGLVGSVKVVMEGAQWSHGCSRKFSEHCSSRWKGVNGWYQTGFGYVYRPKQIAPLLTLARSFSSPSVERNKQDETFVVYPLQFVARSNNLAGDQLRWEVQHWLSPPDPSTNQNFVRRARHKGTAAWFFESIALTEWKSRGSLLWIHGKRMFGFS